MLRGCDVEPRTQGQKVACAAQGSLAERARDARRLGRVVRLDGPKEVIGAHVSNGVACVDHLLALGLDSLLRDRAHVEEQADGLEGVRDPMQDRLSVTGGSLCERPRALAEPSCRGPGNWAEDAECGRGHPAESPCRGGSARECEERSA
jgi:hypothetical protein